MIKKIVHVYFSIPLAEPRVKERKFKEHDADRKQNTMVSFYFVNNGGKHTYLVSCLFSFLSTLHKRNYVI